MSDLENFSLEDGGKVGEGGEGVSEAAMGIVVENIKKAKKVQAQIQQQSAHNNDLALMLGLLLRKINDDVLIKKVIMLISEDIDISEIFAIFSVFLMQDIQDNPRLLLCFPDLHEIISVSQYSDFIKQVLQDSKTLKNIEKSFFISIIYDIIIYFDIGNVNDLIKQDLQIKQKLIDGLEKDIYNLN